MTRKTYGPCFRLPEGRYAICGLNFRRGDGWELNFRELWLGADEKYDALVYDCDGRSTQGMLSDKEWGAHVRLILLTDDEAAHLVAAATLLDLRDEAWDDYLKDFVSTLTNEGAPA